MNKIKLSLILAFLSLSLLACNDKPKPTPTEEVYNFRNEKYQDFYSKLAREVERKKLNVIMSNDGFEKPFDKKYINDVLGLDVKDDILFKLVVSRTNPKEHYVSPINFLSEKEEVLNFYYKDKQYQECPKDYQVDGLLCIDYLHYFYIPKYSNNKANNIYQTLDFQCSEFQSGSCRLFYYGSHQYNIKIFISFSDPQDFFRIISYVEEYIYQATGEHIWQTSLSKK
ncbi:hypothetical protein [Moraxella sp. ZY210820]|uniref:hypothetical protein n=1 Tax=unclassified Moraxella TaxID=2685852 RepID=UPI002731585A|nr:hypothetical protein [Moraxella sp. ZY210820]WLF84386.1 hypothetical protein LU301_02550 [Moraxella sp. ZY210820]